MVVGAGIQSLGPGAAGAIVDTAHRLGFGSAWTVEGRGFEAFGFLGAAGQRNPGLDLGTGISPAPLRPPTLAAMAASTLQATDPSRTVWLGLGTSSPVVAGDWHGATYGPQPVARLREYVTVVRRAMGGDRVTFDGRFYTIRRFRLEPSVRCDPPPRVVLAALNPTMVATAGELADGVLLNALPLSVAADVVERAVAAGNNDVFGFVHVGVSASSEGLSAGRPDGLSDGLSEGREVARRSIASEIRSAAYARFLTAAGYGTVVAQVRDLQATAGQSASAAAVPDEMCDDIFCFGAPDAARAFVDGYERAGLIPVVMPEVLDGRDASDVEATLEAVAP